MVVSWVGGAEKRGAFGPNKMRPFPFGKEEISLLLSARKLHSQGLTPPSPLLAKLAVGMTTAR